MKIDDIKNVIKELIEKTNIIVNQISITEEIPHNTWFKVEVNEPYFFINREGEGLLALNHLVRRIFESKTEIPRNKENSSEFSPRAEIFIDINGFQQKKIENIRAVA